MVVAVDATGTKLIGGSSVSTINYTGITVGAGLSNGALLVTLALGNNTSSAWTAHWDSTGTNQLMTVIKSQVTGAGTIPTAVMFGLLNPTAGNKTLSVSWTTAGFPTVEAISFSGVNQTSIAAAFPNAVAGTTSSLAVTSATGDIAVAMIASAGLTSLNQTSIYLDTTSSGSDSAASRAAGAASVTFTASGATGNLAMVGTDIAAAGAAAFLAAQNSPILQAVKRGSYW